MITLKREVMELIDNAIVILLDNHQKQILSNGDKWHKNELVIRVDNEIAMHIVYAYILENYTEELIIPKNSQVFSKFDYKEESITYLYTLNLLDDTLFITIDCSDERFDDSDLDVLNDCFVLNLSELDIVAEAAYEYEYERKL